jgi:regulator of cell morphogenesis and NO signaling
MQPTECPWCRFGSSSSTRSHTRGFPHFASWPLSASGGSIAPTEPLAGLTEHIVTIHHAYCKAELPRLSGLAAKVVNRHGGTNPELALIRSKLAQLAEELTQHLAEEEIIVFPMIAELERRKMNTGTELAEPSVSVGYPVALLIKDHDNAGVLLAEIRRLSSDFITPKYACTTYHAFYDGLREFEHDLHRHVHLENNILFPRVIELEASSG